MTWYPQDYISNLPMTAMDMRSSPSKNYQGRTYHFYKGQEANFAKCPVNPNDRKST